MPNDEQLALEGEQNADQQPQELELEGQGHENLAPQGGNPLDEFQDVGALRAAAKLLPAYRADKADALNSDDIDVVRAEAKKIQAIGNRHTARPPKPPEAPKPAGTPPQGDYLTRKDFELTNQKKAIRLATLPEANDSDEVKAQKKDIADNWDQVRTNYTPRRGKDTPEDIFEDIKDAYVVFNARRKPAQASDDSAKVLSQTAVPQGTGAGAPAPKVADKIDRTMPRQPSSWYPKS